MDSATNPVTTSSAGSPPEGEQAAFESTGRGAQAKGLFAARYAMLFLLGLLVLIFSVLIPNLFFTYQNLVVLLTTNSVLAVVAVAMVVPLIIGEFDLSVAANMGLAEILVIGLMANNHVNVVLAILIAIGVSFVVGAVNGLLVARIGINSLISTLGMATVIQGVVNGYSGGRMINGQIDSLVALGRGSILRMPLPVFYMAGLALIAWYVLGSTPLGRYLYAIGGSKEASRLAGINVKRLTLLTFMVSGVLAGIAGVMLAAKLGSGNPNAGSPLLLPGFAAAFLGAAAIKPGTFNVAGTIVAVFTLATGVTGLQLMGAPFWLEPIFNGVALIVAVGLTRYLRREAL